MTSKFTILPQVVARQVGDETVILNVATGTYFGLDPVGTRIWKLLEQGETLAGIRDAMLQDYEVSREKLESDLLALTKDLMAQNLISMSG